MENLDKKKVSVIIPAYNEEKFIQKTIESIKKSAGPLIEIIVVVNGSNDKTFKIAKIHATKTINFLEALGPGAARNEGAKLASGDIFIFLDADTEISQNAIKEIMASADLDIVGVCSATAKNLGKNKRLRAKIFFAFKNFIHKAKFYKGSIALIFCSRKIFFKIKGFNKEIRVGELNDFIKRAIKAGAEYKFLGNCHVKTSLRRYQKNGYLKMFWFWIKWIVLSILKKDRELIKEYFKHE